MSKNENSNLPGKVLLIDDDPTIFNQLVKPLEGYNIKLFKATDFDSALYLFNQQRFEVVIIELEFEPVSGLVVAQKFRAHENVERANCGIIVVCGRARTNEDLALLRELGNIELLEKPLKAIKLVSCLSRAMDQRHIATKTVEAADLAFRIYEKTGKVEPALKHIDATIDEKFPKQRVKLKVEVLDRAKEYDHAIRLIDEVPQTYPDDLQLLNMKGRVALKANKPEIAKECLEKADKIAPQNMDRVRTLAQHYLDTKNPDHAVEKMKEIISMNPELKDLRFDLFKDLENAGFQSHAISLCKETTEPTEVVRFYNNKGVLLGKDGKSEEALKEYYTALLYYPKFKDNYRILFNIALTEAKKKNTEGFKAAKSALEKCLDLMPDYEKGKTLLEQIKRVLGEGKPAEGEGTAKKDGDENADTFMPDTEKESA